MGSKFNVSLDFFFKKIMLIKVKLKRAHRLIFLKYYFIDQLGELRLLTSSRKKYYCLIAIIAK